jgi:xylulokinase
MQAHPPTPLFLGLDLSTQQLKAVLVSQDSQTVHSAAVNFDDELAHFGTVYGSHSAPASGEVTSPVRMWLEAVDLLLGKMKAAGVDFGAIAAVSGAGQVQLRLMSTLVLTRPTRLCYSNTVLCTGRAKRKASSHR